MRYLLKWTIGLTGTARVEAPDAEAAEAAVLHGEIAEIDFSDLASRVIVYEIEALDQPLAPGVRRLPPRGSDT